VQLPRLGDRPGCGAAERLFVGLELPGPARELRAGLEPRIRDRVRSRAHKRLHYIFECSDPERATYPAEIRVEF
jgi:hypothetical protein